MKTTITRAERLQLDGIAALAARRYAEQEDLIRLAAEIVGEAPDINGHAGDFVCCGARDPNVDELLRRMNITVADAAEG